MSLSKIFCAAASIVGVLGGCPYADVMHGNHQEKPGLRPRDFAPDFKEVNAVIGTEFSKVSLSDYAGKYVVLLFYPFDFTYVCPTELIAFSEQIESFKEINAEVLGVSTDSHFTHLAWVNTGRTEGGLG